MNDSDGRPTGRRLLGDSAVDVSAIGVGTDSWGSRLFGYGRSFSDEDLYDAYRASLDAGIDFFDTAPRCGGGKAEEFLGRFRREDGRPAVIATKYENPALPVPLFRSPSAKALVASLDNSLKRLGVERIDLYQIHYPVPHRRVDEFADVLATMVRSGKIRAVGVCNFNALLMRAMHASLVRRGVPLASNQLAFNLLDRSAELSGVLDTCRRLNVALIPCLPLAAGILSGKHWSGEAPMTGVQQAYLRAGKKDPFHLRAPENTSRTKRALSPPPAMKNLGALFTAMQAVADTREKSLVQVALNWLLTAEPLVIPIPEATSAGQARENAGAMGWRLTAAERQSLSRAASGDRSRSSEQA